MTIVNLWSYYCRECGKLVSAQHYVDALVGLCATCEDADSLGAPPEDDPRFWPECPVELDERTPECLID